MNRIHYMLKVDLLFSTFEQKNTKILERQCTSYNTRKESDPVQMSFKASFRSNKTTFELIQKLTRCLFIKKKQGEKFENRRLSSLQKNNKVINKGEM